VRFLRWLATTFALVVLVIGISIGVSAALSGAIVAAVVCGLATWAAWHFRLGPEYRADQRR
jgi:membrane associated rhomboid family serine protease